MGRGSKTDLNKRLGENDVSPEVRAKVGKTASISGIVLNALLGVGKLITGWIFGLISVMGDGLNNLSDCGTCAVSLVGFKLASKPADREHPFGHRRVEYIASLIVALIVLIFAFELAKESVVKIIWPRGSEFSFAAIIVLAVSVAVKTFMFIVNLRLSKKVNSIALKAAAIDSITDVSATIVVLIGLIVGKAGGFQPDGYLGAAVAIVIAVGGIKILRDTMSKLMGQAVSHEQIQAIKDKIASYEGVCGLHDLTVHSYGEGVYYASVHVEVDASLPAIQSHELIDKIERDFASEGKISLVVHMDPIPIKDDREIEWKRKTEELVKELDPSFSVHDLRFADENGQNLVFEVAVPFETKRPLAEIKEILTQRIRAINEDLNPIITVEYQIE